MRDHIENLRKGQFIVITKNIKAEDACDENGFVSYPGQPFEVLAVDFPFIAVKLLSENSITALDVREYEFKVTTRRYAQQFMGGCYYKCPVCNHNLLSHKVDMKTYFKCVTCSFQGHK